MSYALIAEHLVKSYDGVIRAVDDISFSVPAGQTWGLLGGNGAGKTTSIAMMLGLLIPTSGRVLMLGCDMHKERQKIAHRLNFSSPYVDMPGRLTVRENLVVYGHLYGIERLNQRIDTLIADLDLTALAHRSTASLSAGQKTRLMLAKSLLNMPDILLLDEPTASLDPDTGDFVRTYLEQYQRSTGATMLLASHNMAEVERMCDHVLMMKKGRVVDQDSPSGLIARYGRQNLEQVFLDIARAEDSALDKRAI